MERDCFYSHQVMTGEFPVKTFTNYIMGDYGLICLGSVDDKTLANIIVSALNNLVLIRDNPPDESYFIAKTFLEEISDLNPKKIKS